MDRRYWASFASGAAASWLDTGFWHGLITFWLVMLAVYLIIGALRERQQ